MHDCDIEDRRNILHIDDWLHYLQEEGDNVVLAPRRAKHTGCSGQVSTGIDIQLDWSTPSARGQSSISAAAHASADHFLGNEDVILIVVVKISCPRAVRGMAFTGRGFTERPSLALRIIVIRG